MESPSLHTLAPFTSLFFFFPFLRDLRGEGRGEGWHLPLPLVRNKGMQLERQRFLLQYGWGEKVITCLGFHCENGCSFHWETLRLRGLRGGQEGTGHRGHRAKNACQ